VATARLILASSGRRRAAALVAWASLTASSGRRQEAAARVASVQLKILVASSGRHLGGEVQVVLVQLKILAASWGRHLVPSGQALASSAPQWALDQMARRLAWGSEDHRLALG